jgi:hypothetical protein
MYVNNLIRSSSVPRYRKLSSSNNAHKNTLSRLAGHGGVLRAVGFTQREKTSAYEWQWTPERIKSQQSGGGVKEGASDPQVPDSQEDCLTLLREAARLLELLKTDRPGLLKTTRQTLLSSEEGVSNSAALPVVAVNSTGGTDNPLPPASIDAIQNVTTDEKQTPLLTSFDQVSRIVLNLSDILLTCVVCRSSVR